MDQEQYSPGINLEMERHRFTTPPISLGGSLVPGGAENIVQSFIFNQSSYYNL